MIKDCVIYFGRGTIVIDGNPFSKVLIVTHIDPPKNIGESISFEEDVKVIKRIKFPYGKDMEELYNDVKNIDLNDDLKIDFRGFTFDFTAYNEESVRVVKNAIERILLGAMMLLAC